MWSRLSLPKATAAAGAASFGCGWPREVSAMMILELPVHDRTKSLDLAYANLTAPIARRIERLRRRARLTRHDLAVRLDSTDAFVGRLENGGSAITAERVRKVARALRTREELFYPYGRPDLFWNRVDHDLERYA